MLLAAVSQSDARPHKYKGVAFIRSGSATKQMPERFYQQMLAERVPAFDLTGRRIPQSSVAELSTDAIAKLTEILIRRNPSWKNRSIEQILSDLLLLYLCDTIPLI